MGIAAKMSAETGREMLAWMQQQATTTNRWADEDRTRQQRVFVPLQDQYIAEAQTWDSPARQQQAARESVADVQLASSQAQDQQRRAAMAMGVSPDSGRFAEASRTQGNAVALASAGAANTARRNVMQEAEAKRANAINMGSGLAVNPATSMGLSNGASQAGFSGAMSGYGQQANILNQDHQNRMQAWQANQQGIGGVLGALGTLAGAFIPSSKEIKHDKQAFDSLGAIRKMPVEKWTYNEGAGDGGTHVGPYAEDFAAATGKGDGTAIDPITMMGVTMGAVRQLDAKVEKLTQTLGAKRRPSEARAAA
ncbi:hypothetical protein GCM10011345_32880 [Gemmobacter megaterium]|nr:tail fiber domain-containing protein [Gemmobacter megaterium]GGE24338.1 hypothetical protein GCM10011345_32880 [Gemmobacter megaterium]